MRQVTPQPGAHRQLVKSVTDCRVEPASYADEFIADAKNVLSAIDDVQEAKVISTSEPGLVQVVLFIEADRFATAEEASDRLIGQLIDGLKQDKRARAEPGSNLLVPA